MGSILPATHLARRYLLFALTALFLLTMLRAIYVLWSFPAVTDADALINVFVQGLRYDLALIGALLLVPVVIGTFLSMFNPTRGLGRFLVVLWLMLAVVFLLVTELLTPWFMVTEGVRPGLTEWLGVPASINAMLQLPRDYPIPAALAGLLCLLVFVAFWQRLENSRLLRFPIRKDGGFLLILFGGVLCAGAAWSGIIAGDQPIDARAAATTDGPTTDVQQSVNELTMNSGYTLLAPFGEELKSMVSGDPSDTDS